MPIKGLIENWDNPSSQLVFSDQKCYILAMKKDIHPKYYSTLAKCACGNSFQVGSTKEKIEVEICSKCHPFYTGESKLVDTAGRVEKYRQRLAKKRK